MASGSLVGGGPADAPPEKSKWSANSKVYVRKFKRSKPAPTSQPPAAAATPASAEASHPPPKSPDPPPPPPAPTRVDSSPPSASSQNPAPPAANGEPAVVTISLASSSKEEVQELREKLTSELAQVRALIRRIESRQVNLAPAAGYTVSQVSGDEDAVSPVHPEPQVGQVSDFEPPALPPPIAVSQFSGSNDMPEYQEEVYAAEEPQEPVYATEEPASAHRPTTIFRIPSSNDGLVTPVFPKPGPSYAEHVYAYQDPTPPLRQLTISQLSGGHDDPNPPVPAYSEAVYASTTPAPPFRQFPQFPGNGVPISPVSAYPEAVYVSTAPPSHYRPVSEFPQFSGSNEPTFTPLPPRRFFASSEAAGYVPPVHAQPSRRLSISVPDNNMEYMEREKRTPKVNQYYQNSDFILGTEKLPPSDSHKKSKSNGSRRQEHGVHSVDRRHFASAFRSCGALLARLMKHQFGWVFNTPVDVKGLGLHDYYTIIRNPMDLGTVKSRLSKNWYKTPKEFAEDVRLTFSNAMTYNPKGQDVHYMAEQLLQIFEERWPSIEAEFAHLSYTTPKKFLDLRTLERSDSTVHPMLMEPKPRPVNHVSHGGRTPALQKPKAKDLNKRNMTFEEKQKLSTNLSNLPGDKLANIVQIIKKRNASLIEDDEIEVDIDSVDIETLWELDRFVTNYKKSLSKHRRRAELAMLRRAQANNNMHGVVQERAPSYVVEVVRENVTVPDEQNVPVSVPVGGENNQNNGTKSSSSSSSSSDSGSSSSDSDSDSSSESRPESRRSPRT